jgi:hypothetical protein
MLASEAVTKNAVFSLELNKSLTKINGLKYSELFGGEEADLSNLTVASCLIEFLSENAESDITKLK